MYTKILKYGIPVVALVVVVTNSVYLKKLDEVKAASRAGEFDATAYAEDFWDNKLIPGLDNAIDIPSLVSLLETSPEEAFRDHSHALGIGNIRFFLVKGRGKVTAIHENKVSLLLAADPDLQVNIATEYIFGNAVRDASGRIDISEFDNTMDFNNVSAEINRIIRESVLPDFNARVEAQAMVEFTGAIELNRARLNLDDLEIIPITLNVFAAKEQQSP